MISYFEIQVGHAFSPSSFLSPVLSHKKKHSLLFYLCDGRWSSRLLNWEPQEGRRAWGRPAMRWEDALCKFIRSKGESWKLAARDREKWCSWEDEFAEQRW